MGQMIKVVVYWVAVFDQVDHVLFHISSGHDLRDQLSLFLRVSHLPLGVVEKVLMQLSICQSYDDAGSAITCTQKDSGSSCLANNHIASFILLLFCKIKWICQLKVFLWWFSDFNLFENRDILCSHCLIFSSGAQRI